MGTTVTHDNRPPIVPVFFGVLALALVGWLALDWSDPCTGQITDPLGCLAQVAEDQADHWATLPAEWRDWCQQVAPWRSASPWGDLPNSDDEAAFQRWCVP